MSVSKNAYEKLKRSVSLDLKKVNALILKQAKSKIKKIPDISNYLTESGGKRLRPILTLSTSKLFEGVNSASVKLATSVEYIHAATLLHDDVIDESEKRRGKPTANRVWDNKSVVLVGDYLFSQAFKLMVEVGNTFALKVLSDVSAEIVESEVWQLELINDLKLTEQKYIELVIGKTAKLFSAACKVGGIVAGAEKKDVELLGEFGLNLGICFQIIDDLLDYTATGEEFGKKTGNDFLEGKVTLPIIYALKKEKAEVSNLILKKQKSVKDYSNLKTILQQNQVIEAVREVAIQYSQKAKSVLEHIDCDQKQKGLLLDLTDFLIHRSF